MREPNQKLETFQMSDILASERSAAFCQGSCDSRMLAFLAQKKVEPNTAVEGEHVDTQICAISGVGRATRVGNCSQMNAIGSYEDTHNEVQRAPIKLDLVTSPFSDVFSKYDPGFQNHLIHEINRVANSCSLFCWGDR
ncbi:unnamed protein product [Rodentolepis nana]|uniref:Pept_C1 domain-containing protein n=1 Tax=Rodentolepis nana TaxID=102285 RepID=A0A0R3TPI4_RODNA|nr:unnamed protein product [Rodentolepis nana]